MLAWEAVLLAMPEDEWADFQGPRVVRDPRGFVITGDPVVDAWERAAWERAALE